LFNGFRGSRTASPKVDTARPAPSPDLSADIVLFPYDFRQSIADTAARLKAEIDARLESLTAEARRRRVIVVAHSMGGLVARYWLGPLRGARDCQALITVGTPHRGAPKALDWLVNGAHVGPVPLTAVTEVLAGWPSVYELLPRYPAIWHRPSATAWYPHELTGFAFRSGVDCHSFRTRARRSYELHRTMEDCWNGPAGELPEVVPLFSRGHGTLDRAEVAEAGLAVSKRGAEWLPNPGWGGDGTVPAISAIPIELDKRQGMWRPVVERHGPMAETSSAVSVLTEYMGESMSPVRGVLPGRPWLGLDLPDLVLAGTETAVTAELLGCPHPTRGAAGLTLWPIDCPGTARQIDLSPGGDNAWVGEIPGLSPGLYEWAARVVGVAAVDQVTCGDVVAVVAP